MIAEKRLVRVFFGKKKKISKELMEYRIERKSMKEKRGPMATLKEWQKKFPNISFVIINKKLQD